MSEDVPARNPLAFLEPGYKPEIETPAAAEAPNAEAAAPVTEDPALEAHRGPDGRFAVKEPEPALTPAPEAAPEAAPAAEAAPAPAVEEPGTAKTAPDGYVPLAAFQAVRDELKALKTPPATPPTPVAPPRLNVEAPDPEADPDGAKLYDDMSATQWNTVLHWSGKLAEKNHGLNVLKAAETWGRDRASADPGFNTRIFQSDDPYEFLINEHAQAVALQTLAQIRDPAKLARLVALATGDDTAPPNPNPPNPAAETPAAPVIAPPPPPPAPTPPKSLVAAPGTGAAGGAAVTVGPGQAFDATFTR